VEDGAGAVRPGRPLQEEPTWTRYKRDARACKGRALYCSGALVRAVRVRPEGRRRGREWDGVGRPTFTSAPRASVHHEHQFITFPTFPTNKTKMTRPPGSEPVGLSPSP